MKKFIIITAPRFFHWINRRTRFNFSGITIGPIIIIDQPDDLLINHERIHVAQMWETLIIGFYIIYFASYIYQRLRGHSHYSAYRAIPLEQEAWHNKADPSYLNRRKPFAWIKRKKCKKCAC